MCVPVVAGVEVRKGEAAKERTLLNRLHLLRAGSKTARRNAILSHK